MTATAIETERVIAALGARLDSECPVCGGGWFSKDNSRIGSVHHVDCPHKDKEQSPRARPDGGA